MTELKPCPFCGGKAELHHKVEMLVGYSYIYCTRCRTETEKFVQSYSHSSDEKATEAWNRRAESEELKFTRDFIHEHGLDFALASAWNRRAEDGKDNKTAI